MESWYQNLSPYVNDKEFPLRGGKKDLPPVLIGLTALGSTNDQSWKSEKIMVKMHNVPAWGSTKITNFDLTRLELIFWSL